MLHHNISGEQLYLKLGLRAPGFNSQLILIFFSWNIEINIGNIGK